MAELSQEAIAELRATMQALGGTMDRLRVELVNREVYAADQRGIERELSAMRSGFASELTRLARDVEDIEAKVDRAEERRSADRRLLLASFVLPLVLLLLNLYVTSQLGAR